MVEKTVFEAEVDTMGYPREVVIVQASDGTYKATVDGETVELRTSKLTKDLIVISQTPEPGKTKLVGKFAIEVTIKKLLE